MIPDLSGMPAISQIAAVVMLEEFKKNVREVPLGSNRGPDVDAYLRGRRDDGAYLLGIHGDRGAPWCARMVLWAVEGAAMALATPPPTRGHGDLASAHRWQKFARETSRWYRDASPGRVGVMIDEKFSGHVVLVLRADDALVTSVEGNWGNKVDVVERPARMFAGFVDLA